MRRPLAICCTRKLPGHARLEGSSCTEMPMKTMNQLTPQEAYVIENKGTEPPFTGTGPRSQMNPG